MHLKKSIVTVTLLFLIASMNVLGKKILHAPEHKNLQVLPKDISQEDLKAVMDGFTAALNVKCGYCHVRNNETREWDYAADTKHKKQEARDMLKMTNDINAKYFGVNLNEPHPKLAVTCFTCHRGEEHPVFAPKTQPADSLLRPIQRIQQ